MVVRCVLALVIGRVNIKNIPLQPTDKGVAILVEGLVPLRAFNDLGQGQPQRFFCRGLPVFQVGAVGPGYVGPPVGGSQQGTQQPVKLSPGKKLFAVTIAQEAEDPINSPPVGIGEITAAGLSSRAVIAVDAALHRQRNPAQRDSRW